MLYLDCWWINCDFVIIGVFLILFYVIVDFWVCGEIFEYVWLFSKKYVILIVWKFGRL